MGAQGMPFDFFKEAVGLSEPYKRTLPLKGAFKSEKERRDDRDTFR